MLKVESKAKTICEWLLCEMLMDNSLDDSDLSRDDCVCDNFNLAETDTSLVALELSMTQ